MYSTKLRDDRYLVHCIAYRDRPQVMQFLFDTGARYTCCSYKVLDDNLCEKDFQHGISKDLGGFVTGSSMRFYRCSLKQFTIGTIDLGTQDIWITFDPRISDSVLGMDILRKVAFSNDPQKQTLSISASL